MLPSVPVAGQLGAHSFSPTSAVNLINIGIALGAGFISITSPCCLPLVPGYLGYLTGLTTSGVGNQRWRPVIAAGLFVAGFTAVFASLGAGATAISHLLLHHRRGLEQVGGSLIIAVGLTMLLSSRIGFLNRGRDWSQGWAKGQMWAAAPLGASFAITWTPCIGPVLAGILTLAATTDSVGSGVLLLVVYSLGLGLPFLAMSLSVHRVRRWLRPTSRAADMVRIAAAAVMVTMGMLMVTGRWLSLMAPFLRLYARADWPPV